MNCENCGSVNVIEGKLSTGFAGVVFTTKTSQKNYLSLRIILLYRRLHVKTVGIIFSLKLVAPQKVNQNK